MRFFQEQDAAGKMRGNLLQVQGGGKAGRSAADDQDIVFRYVGLHPGIVLPAGAIVKRLIAMQMAK